MKKCLKHGSNDTITASFLVILRYDNFRPCSASRNFPAVATYLTKNKFVEVSHLGMCLKLESCLHFYILQWHNHL